MNPNRVELLDVAWVRGAEPAHTFKITKNTVKTPLKNLVFLKVHNELG